MNSKNEIKPILRLDHVTMVREGKEILKDVCLAVQQGDFIAITGPNGGGKTTLLKILLGLLKPTSGKVHRSPELARIGYLPQKNMVDSHFPVSVRQVIESGLLAQSKKLTATQRNDLFRKAIADVGLEDHADQPIGRLSGGQLQRALLGRAIISRPELLVLDEPLSYIDKAFEAKLYDLIAEMAHTSTIVLVSHEMSTISGMANRHLIVDHTLRQCESKHHFAQNDCTNLEHSSFIYMKR